MYTVTHIYEADFGCEERADGAKAKCVVYLEDEDSVMQRLRMNGLRQMGQKREAAGKKISQMKPES